MPLINTEALLIALKRPHRKKDYYLIKYVSYSYYQYKYGQHTISAESYNQLDD